MKNDIEFYAALIIANTWFASGTRGGFWAGMLFLLGLFVRGVYRHVRGYNQEG